MDRLIEAEQAGSRHAGSATLELRSESADLTDARTKTVRLLHIGERTVLVAEPSMLALYEVVARVARASMPVLIHGETGTGKEIIAEAIHQFGPRADKAVVGINCAAMPSTLFESELFGYEKGAFTGAVTTKPGCLTRPLAERYSWTRSASCQAPRRPNC